MANWRCPTKRVTVDESTSVCFRVSINLQRKPKGIAEESLVAVNFSITKHLVAVLMIMLSML